MRCRPATSCWRDGGRKTIVRLVLPRTTGRQSGRVCRQLVSARWQPRSAGLPAWGRTGPVTGSPAMMAVGIVPFARLVSDRPGPSLLPARSHESGSGMAAYPVRLNRVAFGDHRRPDDAHGGPSPAVVYCGGIEADGRCMRPAELAEDLSREPGGTCRTSRCSFFVPIVKDLAGICATCMTGSDALVA